MVTGFADVIGHRSVLDMLERDLAAPAHAYLFVGPANVGKASVARRFAALLLCGEDEGCRRRALTGNHPDLELVEPDGRTVLSVDRARATVARAVLSPVEAGRKVFLFEEAGMMNDEAANALLKTLEEPSPTTVFLLVAESEDALPATVASRSRTVMFGRVTEEEIVSGLADLGVPEDQAHRAAATSGGRPGLARLLATRPEVAEFRHAWLSVPGRVTSRPGDAFRLAAELSAAAQPLLAGLAEREANLGVDAAAPHLCRFLPSLQARRVSDWLARIVLSYGCTPPPGLPPGGVEAAVLGVVTDFVAPACEGEPDNIQAKADSQSRALEQRYREIEAEAENDVAAQVEDAERALFTPAILGTSKNASYDPAADRLGGSLEFGTAGLRGEGPLVWSLFAAAASGRRGLPHAAQLVRLAEGARPDSPPLRRAAGITPGGGRCGHPGAGRSGGAHPLAPAGRRAPDRKVGALRPAQA